jgi:hypothetical protein
MVLTVDRNGDDFGQVEAISTNKGRDTVERVDLEIFNFGLGRTGVDELDIEVVLLCNSEQHCSGVSGGEDRSQWFFRGGEHLPTERALSGYP